MERGRALLGVMVLALAAGCGDVEASGAVRDAGLADHVVAAKARDAAGRDAGGRDAGVDRSVGPLPANDGDAPVDAGYDGPFDASCYRDAVAGMEYSGLCCATQDDCEHVTPGTGPITCCEEHACVSCLNGRRHGR